MTAAVLPTSTVANVEPGTPPDQVPTTGVKETTLDRSKAARSMLWSVVENGGLAVVSFGSLIIYSRFLSAADFGVFSIVLALVELLDVVVSMLFHDALVQKKDVTALHFDTAFSFTVVMSLLFFAGSLLLSPTFARLVHNPAAESVLIWSALRLPCTAIAATVVAQQRRELAFRTLALRSLVGRLGGAVLGIVLVLLGAGIWGLVAQQVLISLVGSIVLLYAARVHPRLRFGRAEFWDLIGFGASSLGVLFLTFSVKRIFTIVSGVMLGNAAAGYLNLGFRAVDVLWAIAASAVTQVALPILARLQSEPERRERAYRAATELTCMLMYPCFVGIAVVAPEVVGLLFGPAWVASSPYVTVLALLILVQAPRLLITPMLTAMGRPRDAMIGIGVEIAVMVGLVLTVGARSLPWALAVWAARELAAAPVMAVVLQRASGIGVLTQLRGTVTPLVSSLVMGAVVYALRPLVPIGFPPAARLALLVPAGAAAFLLAAWVTGRSSLTALTGFVASARTRA